MEASPRRQEFLSLSVSDLSSSPSVRTPSAAVAGVFDFDDSGAPQLIFRRSDGEDSSIRVGLRIAQIFKLSLLESLFVSEEYGSNESQEKFFSRAFRIGFETEEESKAFHSAFEHWKQRMSADSGRPLENGSDLALKSKFDDKIEASSAKMYFHYYGQLLHQQNMLQDYVRTGSYNAAVIENRIDFHGRVVVDVGAGSGILSLFAAQAGAKHVYAVEASEMAEYARRLIAGNPSLGQRITVIKGKVEEVELPEKADILISEPMELRDQHQYMVPPLVGLPPDCCQKSLTFVGSITSSFIMQVIEQPTEGCTCSEPRRDMNPVYGPFEDQKYPNPACCVTPVFPCQLCNGTLLVNERMLESYVIARDRFLVPNGKMFPTLGRIHMAPFSDEYLYVEIANKALFWQQQSYYGVDLTPLHGSAFQGYFSQPVVDAFDPRLLVSPAIFHTLDFTCIKEEELYEIDIPLSFIASVGTRVHGLACWFDVLFDGSSVQRWLTTAPGAPTTHWYQLRCILAQPLYVMTGQEITGNLRLVAHSAQSYTIYLTMSAKMWGPGAEQGGILQTSTGKLDLKEPYYRLSQPQPYAWSQDQQQQQQQQQPPLSSQGFSPQALEEEGDATILLQMPESPDNMLNR